MDMSHRMPPLMRTHALVLYWIWLNVVRPPIRAGFWCGHGWLQRIAHTRRDVDERHPGGRDRRSLSSPRQKLPKYKYLGNEYLCGLAQLMRFPSIDQLIFKRPNVRSALGGHLESLHPNVSREIPIGTLQ